MSSIVILGAKRTGLGALLGQFTGVPSTQLGATAIKAALEQAGVSGDQVDEVLMGCVLPAGLGQAPARQAAIAATFARIPAFLPVNHYDPSSDFGYRSDPFHGGGAFHAGIDMTGKTGDAIHAAADGVVVRAGWWAGYGKVVVVDHGNGLETRYGHMTRFHVKEGDLIRQGQVVGGMGSTGRSTGTHLHFEVRLDGGLRCVCAHSVLHQEM